MTWPLYDCFGNIPDNSYPMLFETSLATRPETREAVSYHYYDECRLVSGQANMIYL
jgi:hypothetical protein